MTSSEAQQLLRDWLPARTMTTRCVYKPEDAQKLHEAVSVLVTEAAQTRREQAAEKNQDTEIMGLTVQAEQLAAQTAALEQELHDTQRTLRDTQAELAAERERSQGLVDRLREQKEPS